jgi:hypothetical protein
MGDDKPRGEGEERRDPPRIRDIARRLFPGDPDAPLRADVRDAVTAVLNTGDKAKTEMVRMVAREVRHYLQELKLGEDLRELLTNYSLDVHASVSLQPLGDRTKPNAKKKRVAPKKKGPA